MEEERNLNQLYEMAKVAKQRQKEQRRETRLKFEMDPVISNVHERMRITLLAKKERKRGGIMFKSATLAGVIERFDSQYSSRSSDNAPENKAKKVQKIV